MTRLDIRLVPAATMAQEAGLVPASDLALLRRARLALAEAIDDGADHLDELHAEVEDALIAALAECQRSRKVVQR